MKTRTCGDTHVGVCTTGSTFTREEAAAKLVEMGFAFREETVEWVRGDVRGRLAWLPDYCRPDDTNVGTRFWLRRPFNEGEVEVLS